MLILKKKSAEDKKGLLCIAYFFFPASKVFSSSGKIAGSICLVSGSCCQLYRIFLYILLLSR